MSNTKRDRPSWIRHSGVGIEFAAAVAGFSFAGYWIDNHYDTGPWGLLIGLALGLIGGTYNLVRASLAAFDSSKPQKKSDSRDKTPGKD